MDIRIGEAIKRARLASGLTQEQVAVTSGIRQPHLSRIERGHDARTSVLNKLAVALGVSLALEPLTTVNAKPYEDEIANRQYLLGRIAAKRISAETLKQFRNWLMRMRARQGDFAYYRDWLDICAKGPSAVASVFNDSTEYGRYMRAVATVRPFVSQAERDTFYRNELPKEALITAGVRERPFGTQAEAVA